TVSSSAITSSAATVSWGAVSGATSYTVQYRIVGAATWLTGTSTTTSLGLTGLTASSNYQFQVTATCTGTVGTASALGTFTTSAATTTCTDTYEPNESRTAGKTISVNTDITAKIGTSTDKDWFKVTTVSGATKIKVVLDQLPADYDLKLFNSSGSQLAVSQNGSTTAESIIRNVTSAATYYVQVYGYSSAFNANTCYRLRVNASGTNFRAASGADVETEENVNVEKINAMDVLSLFPNPASTSLTINFFTPNQENSTIEIYDMIGKVVSSRVINSQEGFNAQDLDITGLNNGVYFLKMTQSEKSTVKKFVVKH
ncbi:MAG TPA: T9SS type A sorting domain-containing protein, partial [Bacteroidia bacterium]|nr:T9SS type A sorting domain-containing protein [Bacteroidia bacterium]